MALPVETFQLTEISPRAYQHPADRAATAALQRVPYLDEVVRQLIALGYERALRAVSLGGAVRLGERQLPGVWVLHREVFHVLDLDDAVPDLYLTQFPLANAYTIGSKKPIVLLNSELLHLLDDSGRRAVLAHEAAHVHSDHVLYQTALLILVRLGTSRLPALAGLPLLAIRLALLEWFRAAELSCDRAAALVTRDTTAVCRSLMVLTAGAAAEDLSLDAFMAQAADYEEGGKGLDRITKLINDMNLTHPMPVRRARELIEWMRSGEYDRIVGGEYIRRGQEPPLKEETDSAAAHYGDRISGAFQQAGSSAAEIGEQLRDWLSRVSGSA
jgi:Zn-dependent protease with chaperone function